MLKAGVAQFAGSKYRDENIAAVRRLAARAAEGRVSCLCFHELANTAYVPFIEDRALFALAEPESGASVSAAGAIAREHELLLVYLFFERDGERYYNSAVVFGPRGEKLLKYRKHTIPSNRVHFRDATEQFFFMPGDLGFPVVHTAFGITIGLVICYDRNLPEPARCVALNGAELIFIPVTTTVGALSRRELFLRARAAEDVVYVAAASRVGKDIRGAPDTIYIGKSLIVNPRAEIIGVGSASGEDLVVADIDVALLQWQREVWPFLDDRRPDDYAAITRTV